MMSNSQKLRDALAQAETVGEREQEASAVNLAGFLAELAALSTKYGLCVGEYDSRCAVFVKPGAKGEYRVDLHPMFSDEGVFGRLEFVALDKPR